jgi:hypothetical protein
MTEPVTNEELNLFTFAARDKVEWFTANASDTTNAPAWEEVLKGR